MFFIQTIFSQEPFYFDLITQWQNVLAVCLNEAMFYNDENISWQKTFTFVVRSCASGKIEHLVKAAK